MRMPYQPIREIEFAAKSGFITKELWNEFFAYGCRAWQYRLWNQLLQEKIFLAHRSRNTKDVWVLNKRHSLVLKTVGENIVGAPFISQIYHDESMAKIVLTIINKGLASAYRLEPELKKMAPGIKRQYDTTNREKYPDALIQMPNSARTRVAFELELTRKDPKRYRQILEAYSTFKKADMVVFILRDHRLAQTIKEAMKDIFYPTWDKPVGFGSLEDWIKNPTEAKIQFPDRVTTLAEIRNKNGTNEGPGSVEHK